MKFDYCIGNPPYQAENENNHRNPPVYHSFMDAAYTIADKVELITPARFLFNAGQTPKNWNEKMLNDEHFKVLSFEKDGSVVFPNNDIKGGVVISLRDATKKFGKIGIFIDSKQLNDIVNKVKPLITHSLTEIANPKSYYGFNEKLYIDYPTFKSRLTEGNEYIIDADIFQKMPEIFIDRVEDESNYIVVHGRNPRGRVKKFINKKYIKNNEGLNKYKVFITGANGSGKFGEALSSPFVAKPLNIHTQTYMSMGAFDSEFEANACLKYICSKFGRTMLYVLKVTQNNPKDTWKYVPLQDFTEKSDIVWTKSVHEIDEQLYKKYKLSQEEIDFIETNVKEMD